MTTLAPAPVHLSSPSHLTDGPHSHDHTDAWSTAAAAAAVAAAAATTAAAQQGAAAAAEQHETWVTVRVSPAAKLLLDELFVEQSHVTRGVSDATHMMPMSTRSLPISFFSPPVSTQRGSLTSFHEIPRAVPKAKRGPRKQVRRSKSAQADSRPRMFKPISAEQDTGYEYSSPGRLSGGRPSSAGGNRNAPPRTPSRENKRGSPSIGVGMLPMKPKKLRPSVKTITKQEFTSTSLDKKLSEWYGARFSTEMQTRGCHWIPRLLA
jgi:hypothetical protein